MDDRSILGLPEENFPMPQGFSQPQQQLQQLQQSPFQGISLPFQSAPSMSTAYNATAFAELQQKLQDLQDVWTMNNDSFFLCSMAVIIFLMQCGFAFLEAGAVRSKNTTNILLKNLLDASLAIIGYWALGWAFAHGDAGNDVVGLFIGTSQFFLGSLSDYAKFFFQYVFAATASTIVSGAVAERCEFVCFLVYCVVISTFVYPILTHWGWHEQGWMYKGIHSSTVHTTYVDFAGSGLIHLCGGTISFVAAYMIGPRIGRYDADGKIQDLRGHSVPFTALGGFILMFGFLAFNGGSVGSISKPGDGQQVGLAMVNTILCGAWAALTFLVIYFILTRKWTLLLTLNACLTGMVSACAACNNTSPWGSTFTGIGAGIIYLLLGRLMIKWKIDDPLDAFAVHFGGGFWGLFSAVIIARDAVVYQIWYAIRGWDHNIGQAFAQIGWQMICTIAIILWSTVWMYPIFMFLNKIGKFRVPAEIEVKGLDIYKHGEDSYPKESYGHGWEVLDEVLERASVKDLVLGRDNDSRKSRRYSLRSTRSNQKVHPPLEAVLEFSSERSPSSTVSTSGSSEIDVKIVNNRKEEPLGFGEKDNISTRAMNRSMRERIV